MHFADASLKDLLPSSTFTRRSALLAAGFAALILVHQPARSQATSSPAAEWRRSPPKFAEEITAYIKSGKDFPGTSSNFMEMGGEVPKTWEIMKLYSGQVEWEGEFDGFEEKAKLASRTHKIKIKGLPLDLHLYPSQSSIKAWEALAPKSPVRFKGTVEGISAFAPGGPDKFIMVIISLKDAAPIKAK